MRRFLLPLLFVIWYLPMQAETVDEFINAMKNDTTLEYVEFDKAMLQMMIDQQTVEQGELPPDAGRSLNMLRSVELTEVLTSSLPADASVLKRRLTELTVEGLDEIVSTNEGGELSRVWMQTDGQVCKMIVVVNADDADGDWTVLKIIGDIVMDEDFNFDELIQQN